MTKRNTPNIICSMPSDIIYRTIGVELEDGDIIFTDNAQKHAKRRHPDDFDKYIHTLPDVITQPDFIGDDFRNKGKIELIRRINSINSVLIAVSLSRDKNGFYHIHSFYEISEKKIQTRLDKKYLIRRPLK